MQIAWLTVGEASQGVFRGNGCKGESRYADSTVAGRVPSPRHPVGRRRIAAGDRSNPGRELSSSTIIAVS